MAEGGRSVTVRVTGRWRRRRPELRGQAMLVVETGTVRQRFVAMPEPPSLTGAAPGTWRMAFTVPAELAPQLPGKTFLQLGAVMVPLPVGEMVEPAGAGERGGSWARATRGQAAAQLGARRRERATARGRGRGGGRRAGGPDRGDGGRAGAGARRVRPAARRDPRARARAPRLTAEHPLRAGAAQRGRARVDGEDAYRDSRPPSAPRRTSPTSSGSSPGCAGRSTRPSIWPPPRWPGGWRPSVGWPSVRRRWSRYAGGAGGAGVVAPGQWRRSGGAGGSGRAAGARAAARRQRPRGGCWRRRSSSPGRRRPAHSRPPRPRHSRRGRPISRRWRSSRRWSSATRHASDGERRAQALERELADARDDVADARGEVARARSELAQARRELERQRLLNERAYAAIDQVRAELARLGAGVASGGDPASAQRRPVRSRPTS